jgi:hypothetical protein
MKAGRSGRPLPREGKFSSLPERRVVVAGFDVLGNRRFESVSLQRRGTREPVSGAPSCRPPDVVISGVSYELEISHR